MILLQQCHAAIGCASGFGYAANQGLDEGADDFTTQERNPATSKAIWRAPF
jgi:hypothetical protein